MILFLGTLGCSEFTLHEPPVVPPVDPPEEDPDADEGDPPDWSTCQEGWHGQYFNVEADDPDVEPEEAPADMGDLEMWEDAALAFRRFDPSLDWGDNWWPVDEGLADDPAYFAARWNAWLRVTDGNTLQLVLGADTTAWLKVNREEVAVVSGDAEVVEIDVSPGQFPIELRFVQLREAESGLRFRLVSEDAEICYPEY